MVNVGFYNVHPLNPCNHWSGEHGEHGERCFAFSDDGIKKSADSNPGFFFGFQSKNSKRTFITFTSYTPPVDIRVYGVNIGKRTFTTFTRQTKRGGDTM